MTVENGADLAAVTTFLLTALAALILATAGGWAAWAGIRHIHRRWKGQSPQ